MFFTTQLLELGIPVVIALNKSDVAKKKGNEINVKLLSEELKCPVIETVSVSSRNNGLKGLISTAIEAYGKKQEFSFNGLAIDISDINQVEASDIERFEFVKKIVRKVESRKISSNVQTTQDSADRILAHKWLGIPMFAAVMWVVYSISLVHIGPLLADLLVGWIDAFNGLVEDFLGEGVSPVLSSLLLEGIIGGVGAVLGFLPLIMILFFLLALLEDCGYMARAAVVMDRFLKRVGLTGRTIIPMIMGTGCAIPGIMSTRTIKNVRQRRTTAMLTPFMPCGAKLPVIALFAGVFFSNAAWVGTLMYFIGILLIVIGALIVVRVAGEKDAKSFFIIELPEYKLPSIKRAAIEMMSRAKAFIVKAGTIILFSNTVVQMMQTFDWKLQIVSEVDQNTSILASISSPLSLLLIPLGFGAWQLAAAAVTGFIAKENVVGTLAVVYGIKNFIDTEELVLIGGETNIAGVLGLTSVAALSYLMFNLYTPPCFAAIGAMNAEMESKKWLLGAILLQLATGYVVAFIVYQFGTLITTGDIGDGFWQGLIAVSAIIGVVVYLMMKGNKKAHKNLKLEV